MSVFDLRRPLICVSLEPSFSKRSNSRQFVSGGMAGVLMLHEKGWLGNKETVLHDGEGPIWCVEWRGTLIAWANDAVGPFPLVRSCTHLSIDRESESTTRPPRSASRTSPALPTRLAPICSSATFTGPQTRRCSSRGPTLSRSPRFASARRSVLPASWAEWSCTARCRPSSRSTA